MQIAIQLLIGVIACGLFIIFARQMKGAQELKLYAVALVMAALIYLGFVAREVTLGWLALELMGVAVFTLLAWLGVKVSALLLALGWAIHAGWDVLLHKVLNAAFVPDWYPIICAGFDLLLAGYIAARNGTLNASAARHRKGLAAKSENF
jgi:hypothetical protein